MIETEAGSICADDAEDESYQPRLKLPYVILNSLMYAMVPVACLFGFAREAYISLTENTINVHAYVTLSLVLFFFSCLLLLFFRHISSYVRARDRKSTRLNSSH